MTEETAADEVKIVDFDAGEAFDGETVKLKRPFKLNGVVYKQVTLRVPTGGEYERYTKRRLDGEKWDTFGMLTAFSGLSVEALQRMASADLQSLDIALGKLFWG